MLRVKENYNSEEDSDYKPENDEQQSSENEEDHSDTDDEEVMKAEVEDLKKNLKEVKQWYIPASFQVLSIRFSSI